MPDNARDATGRAEDAMAQIIRLREQVETLMRDRVAPAMGEAAERVEAAAHDAASGGHLHCRRRWVPAWAGRSLTVHPLRLVRIALEAERLRLGLHAKRTAGRVVMGSIALALLLGALGFGHIAAWFWLRDYLAGQYVALIFAGIDLLFALLLFLLAFRSSPGLAEVEALAVRRRALESATETLRISALLARLFEHWLRSPPR